MDELNCDNGILVCNNKKKDKVYIGNKVIHFLTEEDIWGLRLGGNRAVPDR